MNEIGRAALSLPIGESGNPKEDMIRVLRAMVAGHSDDWYLTVVNRMLDEVRFYAVTYKEATERWIQGAHFREKGGSK